MTGDFNAKVENDNIGYQDIMGKHGVGENGIHLADFCSENKQVIGGTIFAHKTTWISPNHNTRNQIDHICINKKFRRTLLDMRVKGREDLLSNLQLILEKSN